MNTTTIYPPRTPSTNEQDLLIPSALYSLDTELKMLENCLTQLGDKVNMLDERLIPVRSISPVARDPQADATNDPSKSTDCKVANQIQLFADRVISYQYIVNNLQLHVTELLEELQV